MKLRNHVTAAATALTLTAAMLLTGCASSAPAQTTQTTQTAETVTVAEAATVTELSAEITADTADGTGSELFTERDLTQTADLSEAKTINVSDGQTVTITEEGVYVLTGSAKNACIVIDAADEDKVQLVLDALSIVNEDQPCILVENADKVFLTSAEGSENTLNVTGAFAGEEDAAVYARDDLVLNGLGTVTVSSTGDGIRTNDDLKLTGGTWVVNAADTALKAHESISAADGVYTLTAGSDGLHAENNDDDTTGSIAIQGGTFTIQAGDDGIHATTTVTVEGGALTISAAEGIEATQVIVNDGTVSIQASDDGINAGRKSSALSAKIEINGGEITVVMGSGDTDGIDSNGDLIITGGVIDVTGQSTFDYDGTCTFTGGTVIVNGTQTDTIPNQMMGGGGMGGRGGFGGKRK